MNLSLGHLQSLKLSFPEVYQQMMVDSSELAAKMFEKKEKTLASLIAQC
jgi:hypothetical protein